MAMAMAMAMVVVIETETGVANVGSQPNHKLQATPQATRHALIQLLNDRKWSNPVLHEVLI